MMRRMFERLSSRVAILGFTLGLVTAAGFALGQLYLSELLSSTTSIIGICCSVVSSNHKPGEREPLSTPRKHDDRELIFLVGLVLTMIGVPLYVLAQPMLRERFNMPELLMFVATTAGALAYINRHPERFANGQQKFEFWFMLTSGAVGLSAVIKR